MRILINTTAVIMMMGLGYIVPDSSIELIRGKMDYEKLFWVIILLAMIVIFPYEVTYKPEKNVTPSKVLLTKIAGIYLLPLSLGFAGFVVNRYFLA